MSIIFKAAIAHGVLSKNPLDLVIHLKHDRKHGKALTKAEEKQLLELTAGSEYQLMFAITLIQGYALMNPKRQSVMAILLLQTTAKEKVVK